MSTAAAFLYALTPKEFTELLRTHREWLRPVHAAARLEVSVRTLESWRASGKGPAYKGKGKNIRYHIDDLDAFLTVPD